MQIPCMETVCDPSFRLREYSILPAYSPIASERPLIEGERRGRCIIANLVLLCTTGRYETLGAIGSDVGLRGPDICRVGGGLDRIA